MAGDDPFELLGLEGSFFDKLEQTRLVLCASGLKAERGNVFGSEDTRWNALDIDGGRLIEGLLAKRSWRAEELHRPLSNHHVFALHRVALFAKKSEDRLRIDKDLVFSGSHSHEHVDVQRRNRCQVEGGADSTADGISSTTPCSTNSSTCRQRL